jgi:glycine/D-amino acid oxidase-like deaminating enzyme
MGKCFVIGHGIMGLTSSIGAKSIHDTVITFGDLKSSAGSYGTSRIIRTDYANSKFSQYATRALELWTTHYPQLVNPCGRYLVYRPEYAYILEGIDRTRVEHGKVKCTRVTAQHVMQTFGSKGNFDEIFGQDAIFVYSPEDCAVDWAGFMDSRREMARQYAVESLEEEVVSLDTGFGRVTRITTKSMSYNLGQEDNVILATGGWTARNMEQWGIPKLAASHQPVTVVIISFDIEISEEELAKFKDMSIFAVIGCSKSCANFEEHFKLIF